MLRTRLNEKLLLSQDKFFELLLCRGEGGAVLGAKAASFDLQVMLT